LDCDLSINRNLANPERRRDPLSRLSPAGLEQHHNQYVKDLKVNLKRLLFSLFLALVAAIVLITPALAIPPLPSSFYGQVKANGQNVPDGTLVRALIAGKAYATTRTLTYQGNSVFSLNIPGDEADTASIEGGKEGDTIQFEVGGVIARQTGVWHSGTNVDLDLDVATTSPLATPLPALPSVPTQTAISFGALPTLASGASRDGTAPGVLTSPGFVIGVIVAGMVIGGTALMLRRRKK
jgi:hypothetical protein